MAAAAARLPPGRIRVWPVGLALVLHAGACKGILGYAAAGIGMAAALEHFTILPSAGSQDGEPFGEEPPRVRGSLDGHLPWETALREPSRLVRTGSRPTSHRGGHWFDPSIAHRRKSRSEAPRTALILLCGWELLPSWEEFGRSCPPARACIAGLRVGDEYVETAMRRPERVVRSIAPGRRSKVTAVG
jgi:hypothetical protein